MKCLVVSLNDIIIISKKAIALLKYCNNILQIFVLQMPITFQYTIRVQLILKLKGQRVAPE